MLEGLLYDILSLDRSADAPSAVLRLLPDSPVYAAHFPSYPITPGVCLVRMVREVGAKLCGSPLSAQAVKNIKFVAPVIPSEIARIVICFDPGYQKARILGGETGALLMKMEF